MSCFRLLFWMLGVACWTGSSSGAGSEEALALSARREALAMRRAAAVERVEGRMVDRRGVVGDPVSLRQDSGERSVVTRGGQERGGTLSAAMPPPASKRPSIRLLSRGLGLSGPLGVSERRDE